MDALVPLLLYFKCGEFMKWPLKITNDIDNSDVLYVDTMFQDRKFKPRKIVLLGKERSYKGIKKFFFDFFRNFVVAQKQERSSFNSR